MWRPFVILFIVTTNLCTPLDSYKITNDRSSRTIQAYDQGDSSNQPEEYIEENYSNEDSYRQSSGRVVIGKWRNNGEALEPKWRDGDSVPLAPFSTISFKSGWRKESDSREEDYQIEPESFNENGKEHLRISLVDQDSAGTENRERYPLDDGQRVGYKNAHRKDRQFAVADVDEESENSSHKIRPTVQRLSSTFKEPSRKDNADEDVQGSVKYRDTLPNYPTEYELFENENDNPRPRKRRPPQHYEFPGSWSPDNSRKEEPNARDKTGAIEQSQSSNMASDVRQYLLASQDPRPMNQTKGQENAELKTFLKMQGGELSLSEILQQKNLTLADLLKGKPNAIKILKSNEKRPESVQEENSDSTTENSGWSTPRRIGISQLNRNPTISNFGTTSLNLEMTTLPTVTTTLMEVEDTVDTTSPFDIGKFVQDNETVLSEKFVHVNPVGVEKSKSESEEFLKPLENRESLITESTTVVEDGAAEYSLNKQYGGMSNSRFVPERNNDEDEIMEFSDYPAAKMPKFVPAVIHKTATLNTKRKNIPFSAIRTTVKPTDDPELKLSIENILSPENKVRTIDNASEDSQKIVNEIGVKSLGVMNGNDQSGGSERVKNDTTEIKLVEETPAKMNEDDKENEGNDFVQNTKESNTQSYVYDTSLQEQKNLSLNHKLHEVVIPKVDPQSRAEILELFSSGSSAERLERLLASRNMTIEELIALRQRGSSQVHFAQVFKAKEQASTSLPQNYKTDYQVPENHNKNEKGLLKENSSSSDITSPQKSDKNTTGDKKKETFEIEDEYLAKDLLNLFAKSKNLRKNVTLEKTNRNSDTAAENLETKSKPRTELKKSIGNSDLTSMQEEFPTGNNIQRDSEGSSYYTSIEEVKLPVGDDEKKQIPDIFEEAKMAVIKSVASEEIGRVEEILDNDLNSIKNGYGIPDYEFSEKKALSKVKPSIIASGGILGVTIVVFLSIFIACRIRQKKKFAYKNSFTKAVFHNPVMTARKLSNTSSVNTIMVDVVATSTVKRPQKHDAYESDDFEPKSDIDNDSLDANDSWDTIPDFMK